MTEQLLDGAALLALVPYSRQHIARLEAEGRFPRRRKLGLGAGGRVVWLKAEVDQWIAQRTAVPAPPGSVPPGCRRGRAAGRRGDAA